MLAMVDWQVTATTLLCEAVNDEVTVMVYKDWNVKCTGHEKYLKPSRETARIIKRNASLSNRTFQCEGLDCAAVRHYRDKLIAEEAARGSAK
ncbi:MAG: hypothetical protein HYX90_01970 [Chloroflexi bacterium]|nr:hypothetical protein [Chloroflexota bacterium]